jgi:hypothetical protein
LPLSSASPIHFTSLQPITLTFILELICYKCVSQVSPFARLPSN